MTKQSKRSWETPLLKLARGNLDVTFLLIVLALLTFGLVMLFSASYSYAYYEKGKSLYYISRQAGFAVVGVAVMLGISKIDFTCFRYWTLAAFGISFVLLVLVLFLPEYKPGFKRWIDLKVFTFQPSEIAKVSVVLFFAWACEKYQERIRSDIKIQLVFIGISVLFAVLVYLENHLSGAILMALLSVVMLFIGGFDKRWFIVLGILAAVAIFILISNPDLLKKYMGERITAWLDKDYDPRGARWQTNQSLNAIGSGGLLGQGLGESKQKHMYVSEPQNDFIFAIVCEELGFVGATLILLLYAALVFRGFEIALKCRSRFGAAVAMGIVFQIGLQTVLNVFVVTDTMPNTGISLPFFSYGGTSLVVLLAEMGIVLSISRYSDVSKK